MYSMFPGPKATPLWVVMGSSPACVVGTGNSRGLYAQVSFNGLNAMHLTPVQAITSGMSSARRDQLLQADV